MKIITTEIIKEGDLWNVHITNGNGLKVHIHGMENEKIARQQAKDRIRELKKAKLI